MRATTATTATAAALALAALACRVPAKTAAADGGASDAPADAPSMANGPLDTILDQEPAEFSNQSEAQFRFHSNYASATFSCLVDTGPAAPCTSPFLENLPDGNHTFSVRAGLADGTEDDTPAEYVWTIDTVAPDTYLTQTPPAADNSVMAVFGFDSNEDNVWFDCSVDNAGFVVCESGSAFGPLGDGAHSFAVRAHDRAGNVDASPAIYAWTIDTSTPDTQIDSGPSGETRATTASFTFTSPDAGAGATYGCALDTTAFTACTSPFSAANLAQGSHTFEVRVTNSVGTTDPTPATRTWTIDLTPPDTAITSGPSGTVPVASASFAFTSTEASSTFACSLDGVQASACTSPYNVTGLAQGAHTFAVAATDAAGNTDPTPATASWTVDTIPPAIAITGGPAAAATSGPYVTFTFTVSDGTVGCATDGGAFAACASPVAMNLPAGAHSFAVQSVDEVGNTATATRAWTVACAAASSAGAAGQLHLDDTGQTLANAVAGGAPAVLGDTIAVESDDPAEIANGRFGGALALTAANSDHVTWPAMLPAASALTIEAWIAPSSVAGTQSVFASSDGRIAIDVVADSPSAVHVAFAITASGSGGASGSIASASVAAGAWHHVLVSLAQPSIRLWVDGVRTELDTVYPGSALALDGITLGGSAASAYDGDLDEVWLAETAITDDADALARYCPVN